MTDIQTCGARRLITYFHKWNVGLSNDHDTAWNAEKNVIIPALSTQIYTNMCACVWRSFNWLLVLRATNWHVNEMSLTWNLTKHEKTTNFCLKSGDFSFFWLFFLSLSHSILYHFILVFDYLSVTLSIACFKLDTSKNN